MTINPKCIARLNAAAGRSLTAGQLRDIERRLRRTGTFLARQDLGKWRAMSADQRVLAAAQQAMADIRGEAARKVALARLQIQKTAATEERIVTQRRLHPTDGRTQAWVRDMEQTETYVEAVRREALASMLDAIDAAASGQGASMGRRAAMWLLDVENPAMTRDLALEIFDQAKGRTGNQLAQDGARAWLDGIEQLRQRSNAAGSDIGQLDYGYLPQPHDQVRVLNRGRDTWAADVLPLMDRSRYLNEDGSVMSDAQVLDFLRAAWDTIASGGDNKTAPGQFRGSGARANRDLDHRELHFKDGDSYLAYLARFGGGSMYDAMTGHVARKARDIALMERYGPNPNQQARLQFDLARREDGEESGRRFGQRGETYWDLVSGNASMVAGRGTVARIGQDVRNVQTAGKLGGALLSSLPDLGTFMVTVGYHRLPYFDAIANIRGANTADAIEFLNAHGLMAESLLHDMNRWTGENVRGDITAKVANSTMKLSLLNGWTDGLRRAFGLTMMAGTARLQGKAWADLAEYDRWRLESKGISEADWDIIKAAKLDDLNGAPMLTPEGVRATGIDGADQAATKLLAMYVDESNYAIVNPDLASRAWSTAGLQRGTIRGELWRAAMQFKSFPIAMISRHWGRILDTPQGLDGAPLMANRLAYASALGLSLTLLGAIAFQAKEITKGKDPVPMNTPKFWARAMAQGGAAGFFGDVLLEDSTHSLSRADPLFRLLGPTAGSAADLYELTKGNLDEVLAGKPTHAGAEALRFAQSHAPYVNLWYARVALERALINDVQESLSPGYLSRMKQRARKDWGQDYWWQPGESAPDRAPDFSRIGGR